MNARILLPAAALLLLPLAGHAQATRSGITPVVAPANDVRKSEKPPAALPGARAEQNPIAPSDRPTNDMQPNDALFDAINRGDLPVVKDALARGADLTSSNVLGLTPLELSIDLGRNDITFLLLSMQGAPSGGGRSAPQQGTASAAPPPTPAQRRAQLAAERRADQAAERQSRVASKLQAAPAAQAPALFAGNGGSPNPQSGFVGFGR